MAEIRKFTEDENVKNETIQSSKIRQLNIFKLWIFANFCFSAS